MSWWDIVLTIVNAIATVIAIISAIRSKRYYKKCRALADHTNMSKALVEVEKMLNKISEALLNTNINRQKRGRGMNIEKLISEIGKELNDSYLEMHSCVPTDYASELFKLENVRSFSLQIYINSYISGTVLNQGILDSDDYANCQTQLMKMQDYLKEHIAKMPEKI